MNYLEKEIIKKFYRLNVDSIEYLNYQNIHFYNDIYFFQNSYIRLVCGEVKKINDLFKDYRLLKSNPLFNKIEYISILKEIEAFLLENEMYESLILFEPTNKRLRNLKKIAIHHSIIAKRVDLTNFTVHQIRKHGDLKFE